MSFMGADAYARSWRAIAFRLFDNGIADFCPSRSVQQFVADRPTARFARSNTTRHVTRGGLVGVGFTRRKSSRLHARPRDRDVGLLQLHRSLSLRLWSVWLRVPLRWRFWVRWGWSNPGTPWPAVRHFWRSVLRSVLLLGDSATGAVPLQDGDVRERPRGCFSTSGSALSLLRRACATV